MKIHFIAIGGSAMHDLAIALHKKGHEITGSDDAFFDPSKSRLKAHGLLPKDTGWNPEKVHPGLDAVILGMHAKKDNPELIKAREVGVRIYSYPEFLYEQTKEKKRVVVAGSHGKTTITAMILHVLAHAGVETDHMVGAQLEGYEGAVRLTNTAEIAILEGDEYLSSPIDRNPKFLWYKPHLAIISGMAWDHVNVFPEFEDYLAQFRSFIRTMVEGGSLYYYEGDEELKSLVADAPKEIHVIPYEAHPYFQSKGITYLERGQVAVPLHIFGQHNMQNLEGARKICLHLGVNEDTFYEAISTFKGAALRMEPLYLSETTAVFRDYAHAPSKVKATTDALKEQYPDREITVCIELHTYSSLNPEFIGEYRGTTDEADRVIVFFDPKALEIKNLPPLEKEQVRNEFGRPDLIIHNDIEELKRELKGLSLNNGTLAFMSSGSFHHTDLSKLAEEITKGQ